MARQRMVFIMHRLMRFSGTMNAKTEQEISAADSPAFIPLFVIVFKIGVIFRNDFKCVVPAGFCSFSRIAALVAAGLISYGNL